MSTEKPDHAENILAARAAARQARRERDQEILRMHARAVAALHDPATAAAVSAEALSTLRYWEDRGMSHAENIAAWREILAMTDTEAAARAILEDSEDGSARRQNTPFGPLAFSFKRQG